MIEIRFNGRFGQPVGQFARTIGNYALTKGKHVQIFDSFAAFRPGAPTFSVVRIDSRSIRQRSVNAPKPDLVVVLDNSLFKVIDVTAGLKENGKILALGVDQSVLGETKGQTQFVSLKPYVKEDGPENSVIRALENEGVF